MQLSKDSSNEHHKEAVIGREACGSQELQSLHVDLSSLGIQPSFLGLPW